MNGQFSPSGVELRSDCANVKQRCPVNANELNLYYHKILHPIGWNYLNVRELILPTKDEPAVLFEKEGKQHAEPAGPELRKTLSLSIAVRPRSRPCSRAG